MRELTGDEQSPVRRYMTFLIRKSVVIIFIGVFAVALLAIIDRLNKPRVLAVDEVPIAYWAWRTNAPDPVDLEKAFAITNAKVLFLRAGQFESRKAQFKRIRPLVGKMPEWVEIHLVYNATPELLRDLELADTSALAEAVAGAYREDLERSRNDGAQVFGIQLDLDFPSRLLPKYADLLRTLRETLPRDTKLSITGLPAWMATNSLTDVLAPVDFWIPQCYGASIPTHISERTPISSTEEVARSIAQARRLNKPFYAGLSAYSYAILYGRDGKLIELRGNIDPANAERNPELELVERRPFNLNHPSEVRYEYRARNDLVLDGLVIEAGQSVVFDVPSTASLGASARSVRENAGEFLLGICVFRLPTSSDKAVLTVEEVTAALADVETDVKTKITVAGLDEKHVRVFAENTGRARTILGEDAFAVDIEVPSGSMTRVIHNKSFSSYETLCREDNDVPRPCSMQRANVLRLRSRAWKPDSKGSANLEIGNQLPANIPARVTTHIDDGRILTETFELSTTNNEKPDLTPKR